MAQSVDVLIVGSGPAGTSTALHLLQQDSQWGERIVMVDKAVHPREKLCGGGITHLGQNILIRLGLSIEPRSVDLREARLRFEDKSFSFHGNPVFKVVRRDEFDHWLVRQVERQGVVVHQGEAAKKVAIQDEFVELVTERNTYHAKVLIAADGSRSFVRQSLKWPGESRVARLLEILTPEETGSRQEFRDGVAVFDFTHMVNGLQGYYWDFPSYVGGKPFMNRGLFDSRVIKERPKADLKRALRESLAARNRDLDDYKLKGHPIRWWNKNSRFSMPRVLLVGDAAGADPLMGEGISFALGYGRVAAGEVAEAFARSDFSFAGYRERLRADPLFRQLELRTKLAGLAYRLNLRWLVRLSWQVAPWVLRFTRWRDPEFVPTDSPQYTLDTESSF